MNHPAKCGDFPNSAPHWENLFHLFVKVGIDIPEVGFDPSLSLFVCFLYELICLLVQVGKSREINIILQILDIKCLFVAIDLITNVQRFRLVFVRPVKLDITYLIVSPGHKLVPVRFLRN